MTLSFLSFPFLKSMFAEDDGTMSFGRTGSAVALLATIGWISYIVYKIHTVPDMTGPSLFIGTPYAINKTHAAVTQIFTPNK